MRTRLTLIAAAALAASALVFHPTAVGQPSRGVAPPERKPPVNPVLTRHELNNKLWTLNTQVFLQGPVSGEPRTRSVRSGPIRFDRATLVLPVPRSSSIHDVRFNDVTGRVYDGSNVLDDAPRFSKLDYQAGNRLAIFDLGAFNAPNFYTDLTVLMRSYETRIDEARARAIPWPKEEWPEHVLSALEPQLFVESEDPLIKAIVDEWTGGNAKRGTPYLVAKALAGKVLAKWQPSGQITVRRSQTVTGPGIYVGSWEHLDGFRVNGAAFSAKQDIVAPLDLANLLCAVYRAAGIPSRVVIAYDIRSQELDEADRKPGITALTEFYLYHEDKDFGEWIPVDILAQRRFSSKPPPLDQRWQFFGHNEESDNYLPISYHWHPPTTVVNEGAPSLWGWLPEPAIPGVAEWIRFWAFETPRRGDEIIKFEERLY